ncbi:class I SAM-dependent methyltransferase [Pedosphaera parvula]|uniref:S-adenosyl-L-methionine-dependent methyltransferase n=1 Tax=Pedosphaera parvula (strain Ellin514) TaxID=320771 RepID=B9XKV4_PEDPL|nr:SAM-dependent methyltransferase [Pedosphaera parvula]EEF59597.1 methyltransferase [Pedosphaera parvula Ellin514]
MTIEKEQSHKYSLMAALLSGLIRVVLFPVWLVVAILYEAHVILSSRKLGVSATALGPMSTRWMQHQLGQRRDEACAKLIKVLPNHCHAGLYAVAFPVLLGHRLTGFVPKSLRYPYEGIPPVQHQTHVRSTFADAAIEKYLPGVEQFVELGAGYDTRTVQLQHNHRIRCFEVDLPKTRQLKLRLLHQCGVDTSGVTFVAANFLTDDWLDNLMKAGFDPSKPAFFLWEGVTYYLSREAMEKTFRTIATIAPGSVVVFDYATDAVIKMRRKPLGRLHKAILKAVRESQTFWIPSEPPVKETLATLMDSYGLSLREHLSWGHETKRKRLPGGLAAAVLE